MKTSFILLLSFFFIYGLNAQDKPAYKLFTSTGKEVKWEKAVKDLQNSDMVFFGELHDNPISHWLEYELLTDLYKTRGNSMVLGAEMFESDNQAALDAYLKGDIDDKKFGEDARLWKNYKTDYKPLVDFAKEHNLKFVATNVPRRYASMVFKGDFASLDTLPAEEKAWIAPLPILFDINVPCYQDMLKMGVGHPEMKIDEKYPKAQAIKDATMAYFIMQNKIDNGLFYHVNGSYHSDNFQGIVWHLKQADPELRIKTITSVEQDDISKPDKENLGKASYIIVVPTSMTKTY
ncbi:MAG: ChaN family lipoprotein [Bacteroidales bacterium]|nr:ChaN family lipoprotein [Bacteroidales bacterium]MCB8999759.1 ChaN family lipoprotein [Bacteroidales bacterium]MCB9013431.1 ChaN family lipoprotein [Bacteroidales bacterium]